MDHHHTISLSSRMLVRLWHKAVDSIHQNAARFIVNTNFEFLFLFILAHCSCLYVLFPRICTSTFSLRLIMIAACVQVFLDNCRSHVLHFKVLIHRIAYLSPSLCWRCSGAYDQVIFKMWWRWAMWPLSWLTSIMLENRQDTRILQATASSCLLD